MFGIKRLISIDLLHQCWYFPNVLQFQSFSKAPALRQGGAWLLNYILDFTGTWMNYQLRRNTWTTWSWIPKSEVLAQYNVVKVLNQKVAPPFGSFCFFSFSFLCFLSFVYSPPRLPSDSLHLLPLNSISFTHPRDTNIFTQSISFLKKRLTNSSEL